MKACMRARSVVKQQCSIYQHKHELDDLILGFSSFLRVGALGCGPNVDAACKSCFKEALTMHSSRMLHVVANFSSLLTFSVCVKLELNLTAVM